MYRHAARDKRLRPSNPTNSRGGFVLVDKSKGSTSFKVVEKVRRALAGVKVGHAGTLDPLATGLLVLAVGQACKRIAVISSLEKEYDFVVQLGLRTMTDDVDGKVIQQGDVSKIEQGQLEEIMPHFLGDIKQMPPQISAVKIRGRRAYRMARKGIEFSLKEKSVHISAFELLGFDSPFAHFRAVCSTGTYVRAMARDMGKMLGCGGCVYGLRRVRIGPFLADQGIKEEEIRRGSLELYIQDVEQTLSDARRFRDRGALSK